MQLLYDATRVQGHPVALAIPVLVGQLAWRMKLCWLYFHCFVASNFNVVSFFKPAVSGDLTNKASPGLMLQLYRNLSQGGTGVADIVSTRIRLQNSQQHHGKDKPCTRGNQLQPDQVYSFPTDYGQKPHLLTIIHSSHYILFLIHFVILIVAFTLCFLPDDASPK